MEVGPKATIEAHELEIDCLFEAVDKDGNRSLDLDEVRFFVKQYIEMCNKEVKNGENEHFEHLVVDDDKIKLLEAWPKIIEDEHLKDLKKRKGKKAKRTEKKDEVFTDSESC